MQAHLPWLTLALLFSAALGALLARWAGGLQRRRRAKSRAAVATEGERAGAKLLERLGFAIVAVQPTERYRILVDSAPYEVQVRADYLVCRGGKRWVADVKTGNEAPRVENRGTRRQLLEYRLAYDVCGVLLVDMASREVREIEFCDFFGRPRGWWTRVLAVALAAAAAALAWVYWGSRY